VKDGGADDQALPMDSLAPANIGLTCTVAETCTPRWGRYAKEKGETVTTAAGNPKMVWKRYPMGG